MIIAQRFNAGFLDRKKTSPGRGRKNGVFFWEANPSDTPFVPIRDSVFTYGETQR
jgi:hypothetical protein